MTVTVTAHRSPLTFHPHPNPRQVSWAALKMLTPAEEIRYDEKDPVVGRNPNPNH